MRAAPDPIDELLRVRRHPERGTRDRAVVDAVLDAGFVCHLGYLAPTGEGEPGTVRPVVVPTLYGRDGDTLVLHGSSASRVLRTAGAGLPVCATVTLIDGLVLARSAFHHSVNYRSVVVHGTAEQVMGDEAKLAALRVLTDHVAPGRFDEARAPTPAELKATTVLRLPLTHAVAKVRSGGVGDDPDDAALPVWAGIVPLATLVGPPERDGADQDLPAPRALAALDPDRPIAAPTGVPAVLPRSRPDHGAPPRAG